jgi:hypothetical protein
MKTKFYYVLTLAVVVTVSLTVSNSLFNVDTAYAQSNKLTKEFDGGGGGGEGCSGGTCDAANGLEYGTITYNGVTYCCGATSSSPGKKSS